MSSFSLFTAIFMTFSVSVLTTLALFYLKFLNINKRAAGAWALAFTCICARHFCALLVAADYPFFAMGVDFFLLGFASFLWLGTCIFNDEQVHTPRVMLWFSCMSLWIMVAYITKMEFFWRELPVHFSTGVLILLTASSFWQAYRAQKNSVYVVLAGVILLKGIHLIDYPFLRNLANFAPAEFLMSSMFDLSIGMMLLVVSVMEQYNRAEQIHTKLQNELDERNQAERILKERESLFEKIFQLVPDVLVIAREDDGSYVELNRHWEDVTGYSRTESLGKRALDLGLWVDLTKREVLYETMRSNREIRNMETLFRHKNGKNLYVLISGTCFTVAGESFVLYVMQDATDQHEREVLRQETAMRLSERESVLATVFQLVPDTLTITSMEDGRYVDVNRNWEPLAGFSADEAVGKTSTELNIWVYPDQRTCMIEAIRKDGEIRNMIISFRHKDGHVFQCRVSGTKFETSEGKYLLLSAHNIDQEIAAENARLQAENLRRENEQRYSTIFQLSPIPLGLIKTSNAIFVDMSDSWIEQIGYTREEVIGRTSLEMNFWSNPDERKKMIAILTAEGKVDRFEMHQRHKDGKITTCLLSARLFTVNDEEMFIFSLLDVTRQYQAEKEIHEMTAQLEARVVQRTIKLEHANNELAVAMESLKHTQDELVRSEKMAALGSLVAGIAHELNTPIGNSVTVASTLQDQTQDLLHALGEGALRKSSLDQYLENIRHGSEILMRTLGVASELIRSFKQVAVDQSSNQRRLFDLKDALQEVVSTLKPMYKATPYTLEMELESNIQMDSFPGPLGQIVTNFMTNALSHAFEGRPKGQVHIHSKLLDEHHVAVVFSDDGIGISEGNLKKVFDPFFTTKLGQGGSGLGLNIAYNLVTGVMGGTLKLDSKFGFGTRFTMVLPLSAPDISVGDE